MKKLIIRADDLGMCEAVNYGIEKAVKEGIIRSVGLMPNMPSALHGYNLIKDVEGLCIGQHTNISEGKPLADPSLIPSLLDENGNLISTKTYRKAFIKGKEIAEVDELAIEIEAQYKRFVEIVGHKPSYLEVHSVTSKNLNKALEIVAEKYDLNLLEFNFNNLTGKFAGKPLGMCMVMNMSKKYNPFKSLKKAVEKLSDDVPSMYVCHPGYVDDYVLNYSYITDNRAKELAMLTDPATKRWLDEQNVKLINYDDLI